MGRIQHLQAIGLAIVVLLGGQVVLFTTGGKHYSLRGGDDFYATKLEKQANETLKTFFKTIEDHSLQQEELAVIVKRLRDLEDKLKKPQEGDDVPNKQDVANLQQKISLLDTKLKSHEGSSVNDQDLQILEERLASFESKMNANDLASLIQKMSAFEDKLKTHEEGIIKKEGLDIPSGFSSPMKNKSISGASGTDNRTTKHQQKSMKQHSAVQPPIKPPSLNNKEVVLLKAFNPSYAPIVGRKLAGISNPVKVRVLLMSPKRWLHRFSKRPGPLRYISDEMSNIVMDGFQRSPYFENLEPQIVPDHRSKETFVIQEQDDVIWVVDSRNMAPTTYRAYNIEEEVLHAANATINYQNTFSNRTKPFLKVVFIDYRDKVAGRYSNCGPERRALIKLLGEGNVRQVVGRIAVDRRWNDEKQWIEYGTVWYNRDYACSGTPTIYSPYTVRSDYAEAVQRLFRKYLATKDRTNKDSTPVNTIRSLDVAHYWDEVQSEERQSEYRYHSQLRNAVSKVVSSLNGKMAGTRKITALAATVSKGEGSTGRITVFEAYAESLLTTKIVVVAQRDIWEDHYRLFEAFVGGAMVMTDPMLSLPDGLVDGENIVVYHSRDDLRRLLLHYLDPKQDKARIGIARKGYEVAMGQHRSYHQMERVFFGEPLSSASSLPSQHIHETANVTIPVAQASASTKLSQSEATVNTRASTNSSFVMGRQTESSILTKRELELLDTFNAEHSPIMGDRPANTKTPARVRVLMMSPKKRKMRARDRDQIIGTGLLGDEMINIVLDGFKLSPYFECLEPTTVPDHKVDPSFVLKEPEDVIWVVDSRNLTLPSYHYSVDEDVLIAAKKTVKYQQALNVAKKPSLRVVFVDYHDKLAGRPAMCSREREELIKLLGVGKVRHVVGKVVSGRKWNRATNWIERGTIWDNKDYQCFQKPTLRAPYTVRTDYVETVRRLFRRFLGNKTTKLMTPVDTIRSLDVAHYWDQQQVQGREKEYRYYSHLRNAVSEVVSSLNGTMAGTRKITAFAGSVSGGGSIGRTEVADSYVESLLTTKIVVVAQRDLWEDHYRLFEAFVGGAMVMTDLMISLPEGLIDGENIVMYRSRDDLRKLLLYYLDPKQDEARLSIARKGYEVAMQQHRSFHRMEEVFYGKRLSS